MIKCISDASVEVKNERIMRLRWIVSKWKHFLGILILTVGMYSRTHVHINVVFYFLTARSDLGDDLGTNQG